MTKWIGSWACSAAAPVYFVPEEIMVRPAPLSGTLRHRVRLSAGGQRLRLRLSNEVGLSPLPVGAVRVALAGGADAASSAHSYPVTFAGVSSLTLAPGTCVDSDAIELPLATRAQIDISVYYPQPFLPARSEGVHWAWYGHGVNRVADASLADATWLAVRPNVTLLAVESSTAPAAIVCLGDSLTDGAGTRAPDLRSWTDVLAQRLQQRDGDAMCGVVNAGIGGNQLNDTLIGLPALQRLTRDVFSVPGARCLFVLVGSNDINVGGRTIEGVERAAATLAGLSASYHELVRQARARGIKVIGSTLTPFKGSMFYLDEKEELRQQVNHWLRHKSDFDEIMDFDALLRDDLDSSRLRAQFDSGDGLHPNALGQRSMGEAVPLSLFDCPA